jgi:hypothetical protein
MNLTQSLILLRLDPGPRDCWNDEVNRGPPAKEKTMVLARGESLTLRVLSGLLVVGSVLFWQTRSQSAEPPKIAQGKLEGCFTAADTGKKEEPPKKEEPMLTLGNITVDQYLQSLTPPRLRV